MTSKPGDQSMTLGAITPCKWRAGGQKDVREKDDMVGVQRVLTKSEETRVLDLVQSVCDDCKKATKLPGA